MTIRLAICWLVPAALAACNAPQYGLAKFGAYAPQQEIVLELATLDLPARAGHAEAPQPSGLWVAAPESGWLHGFAVEVMKNGTEPAPRDVLHHIKVLAPGSRELFAPIALRLIGAGAETTEARLPSAWGVPFRAGDSLLVAAMVHNPGDEPLDGVRLRLRLRYSRADSRPPPADVYPFFLHVTPPGEHSGFDLPPGRSEHSWEGQPAVAVRILGLSGHLHRYGVELRLEDVTAGRLLWRVRPRTDGNGDIVSVPRTRFAWGRGIKLHPEHVYRVTAVYENPTDHTLMDAGMGTIGGVVLPSDRWPPVNRLDLLYRRDLAQEAAGGPGHQHRSHGHRH
jgi:hypothetical protein